MIRNIPLLGPQEAPAADKFPDLDSFQAAGGAAAYGDGPVWIGGAQYFSSNGKLESVLANRKTERKVLVLYDNVFSNQGVFISNSSAQVIGTLEITKGMLERMGYAVDTVVFNKASTWIGGLLTGTYGYEFVVYLGGSGGSNYNNPATSATQIFAGLCQIPVFITNMTLNSATHINGFLGMTRLTSQAYGWCTHHAGFQIPGNFAELDATSANAAAKIVPIITHDNPVASANYLAKPIAAGKFIGDVNNVYFEGAKINDSILLSVLIQEAINDGKIAPPDYKCTGAIDIDDFPDATNTVNDLETVYALMQKHNFKLTCGLQLAVSQAPLINLDNWAFVAAHTPDKGGLLCAIDHDGDAYWSDPDQSVIDADYLGAVARANSYGISMGYNGYDQWGYRFFNTNAIASTGLNVCQKYGIKAARFNRGVKAPRLHTNDWIRPISNGNSITEYNGVLCIDSETYINPDTDDFVDTTTLAGIERYNRTWRMWMDRVLPRAGGVALYFHGNNFYQNHSGGNAPGYLTVKMIAEMCEYCSDVMGIVHPTEFIAEHHSKFNYITE